MKDIIEVYKFISKYNQLENLNLISSSFLYLSSNKEFFTKQNWIDLTKNKIKVANDLSSVLFNLLIKSSLLYEIGRDKYQINKEKLYESFNYFNIYKEFSESIHLKPPTRLLWSMNHELKQQLPNSLRIEFDGLTSYIKDIISRAKKHIIFCAPYYSTSGLEMLISSIQAALDNNVNLQIWFIVDALEHTSTKGFIAGITDIIPERNVKLFLPKNPNSELLFHSKFLIVDSLYGYMGSANFSRRAFSNQFEIGIKLNESESLNLALLVNSWLGIGFIEEQRSKN